MAPLNGNDSSEQAREPQSQSTPAAELPDKYTLAGRTKRERSIQSILDAARTLIERDGYARTTVNGIAKEAGLGIATLYNHFPTKGAVVAALFEEELRGARGDPAHELPENPTQDLRHGLTKIARAASSNPRLAEALLQASSGPPTRAEQRKKIAAPREQAAVDDLLAPAIRAGQADGAFRRDVEADELARVITHTMLDRVVSRPDEDPVAAADTVTSIFVAGISTGSSHERDPGEQDA